MYFLWRQIARDLTACGRDVPDVVRDRLPLLLQFLADATMPNGHLVPLGDTFASATAPRVAGTPGEYAATLGEQGTAAGGRGRRVPRRVRVRPLRLGDRTSLRRGIVLQPALRSRPPVPRAQRSPGADLVRRRPAVARRFRARGLSRRSLPRLPAVGPGPQRAPARGLPGGLRGSDHARAVAHRRGCAVLRGHRQRHRRGPDARRALSPGAGRDRRARPGPWWSGAAIRPALAPRARARGR